MRKKLFILALLSCCITAYAQVTSFPWTESFTGCTTLPSGWDNSDYTNSGYSTSSATLRWNLMDEALHFYGNNSALTRAAVKSPLITLPSNMDMSLSFRMKNAMTCGSLGLYVSTDSGATYLQNPLDTALASNSWTDHTLSLAAYRGQTIRLVFYGVACTGVGQYYTDFYIDDLEIDNTPICQTPMNLSVSALTDSSALLNWTLGTDGVLPDSYQMALTDGAGSTIRSTVTTPYYATLDNLSANTTYTVTIRSDCSSSSKGFSPYSTLSFRTLCNPQSLPYSEDFDNISDIPGCCFSGNASIATDISALKLTAQTSEIAYFITPLFSMPSDSIEVSLRMKRGNPSITCRYRIGLLTDPSDIAGSFVELRYDSIYNTSSWIDIRVNSANVSYATNPVAVCIFVESGYNISAYIDDLTVRKIPTCIRPENLTVSAITSSSATLQWTTCGAPSYRITLIEGTDTSYFNSAATTYTFTNLTSNVDFRASVRAICATNDSSDISPETAFSTLCAAATTPLFTEGFEASALPTCWQSGWTTTPTKYDPSAPFITTSTYHHGGLHSLSLVAQTAGNHSYISTLLLPIGTANTYDVSLYVWRDMQSDSQIKVWASTSATSTTGATLLGTVSALRSAAPAEASDGWYNYQFPITTAGNLYILIEGIAGTKAMYIDDLAIIASPSCRRVSGINATATSGNSISLGWTPNGTESQWRVSAQLVSGATATQTSQTVSTPQLTLNNLTAGSYYNIAGTITSLCSAADSSEAVAFNLNVQTPCTASSALPITEGFESSYFPPLCWVNTSASAADSWSLNSDNRHAGAYSTFASSHFTGSRPLLSTPQFTLTATPSEVKFFMYRSANHSYIQGEELYVYLATAADTTGATLLGTIPQNHTLTPAESQAGWYPYIFAIPQGTTGSHRILFVYHSEGGSGCYIDDIAVRSVPDCADLTCEVDDISSSSAKVRLTTTGCTSWQYSLDATQPVTVSGDSIIISGLAPLTTYQLRVRRICGTEYGDWSDAITFTTLCAAATLPYTEDFETSTVGSAPACLAIESYYESTVAVLQETSSDDYNHTGGGANGLAAATTSSNSTVSHVTNGPIGTYAYLHLVADADYEFSFYTHCSATAGMSYNASLYYGLVPDHTQMTLLMAPQLVTSTEWVQQKAYFSVPTTGDYYVGIYVSAPVAGTSFPFFIDDISVRRVSCLPPVASHIVQTGNTSAQLSINVTSGTRWEVAVCDTPITTSASLHGNIYHNDNLTSTNVTINGLTPSTTYYYTFRTVCQAGVSAWLEPQQFTTRCQTTPLPYSNDFEDAASAACWNNAARTYIQAHSGIASLSLPLATVSSPEFSSSLKSYTFTAWVMAEVDSANISLGAMTNPDDASTFEPVTDIYIPYANVWYPVTCPFDSLSDTTARYLAISNILNDRIFIDDIDISPTPSCPQPYGLQLVSATDTSVTISTSAASAVYRLVPVNSGATVTATTTTISGLTPSTTYAVYAATVCSSSDTSAFSMLGYVNTNCGIVTAPFAEDFGNAASNAVPRCWTVASGNWKTYEYDGNRMLRLTNLGYSGASIIRSPRITLTAGKSWRLSLDYSHRAYCGNFYVRIYRANGRAVNLKVIPQGSADHLSSVDPGTMTHLAIDLSAYAGETLQIQLNASTTNQSGAIFVDNIAVSEILPCSEITSFSLDSLSDVAATVSFADTCATHTEWQYAVGEKGFSPDEATPYTVNTNSINLNGLTAATSYDICVRTACSATSHSNWTRFSFTTLAGIAVIPYETRFSDADDNSRWRFRSLSGSASRFVIGPADDALLTDTSANALYVSLDDGASFAYDVYHSSVTNAYRTFRFGEGSYDFNISYSCNGGISTTDYARMYLIPANLDIPTPAAGAYIKGNFPSSCIALDGGSPVTTLDGWQHISKSIDFTGRSGLYNMVFLWSNDSTSGRQSPLGVGYISVANTACNASANASVVAALDTATVILSGTGTIEYRLADVASPEAAFISGQATAGTMVLRGLEHSTRYYLFVRAVCPSGVSLWTMQTFTTTCAANTVYPFTEDFSSPEFPPVCWSVRSTATGTNWDGTPIDGSWEHFSSTMETDNYANSPGAAEFSGYTGAAAALGTPLMHFDSAREYHISFYMYRRISTYATAHLTLYLSHSEVPDRSTITLADYTSYDPTATANGPRRIDIDVPRGTSGDYRLLFEGHYISSPLIFVDDVTIDAYPPCREPLTPPTILSSTQNTITAYVDLRSNPSATVAIAPYTPGQTTVADSIASITTTDGTVVFQNLATGSEYALYARINCSADNCSEWSAMSRVTTKTDSCFAPDGLRLVGSATPSSATVTFAAAPSALSYEYILTSPVDTLQGSTLLDTLTFSALTSQRTYTLRLRALCSDGDTTVWSQLQFTTLAPSTTAPYATGFEDATDNAAWQFALSSSFNNFVISGSVEGHQSGNFGLYISNDNTSYAQSAPASAEGGVTYNIAYAYRTIWLEAGTYEAAFDWRCDAFISGNYGTPYNAFGRAFLAPAATTLSPDQTDYINIIPANSFNLYPGRLDGSQSWSHSALTAQVTTAGYYIIAFGWYASNTGSATSENVSAFPLAIDNFSIAQITCLPPLSISVLGTRSTTADIYVEPATDATIEYAISTSSSVDSITTILTATSDTISLSGLAPKTTYHIFARHACTALDFSPWRTASFTTNATEATAPYACQFADATENSNWIIACTGQTNYFIVGNSLSNGIGGSLYITNDGSTNQYTRTVKSVAYAYRTIRLDSGYYDISADWRAYGRFTTDLTAYDYGRIFLIPASEEITEGTPLMSLTSTTLPADALAMDGGNALINQGTWATTTDIIQVPTSGDYNIVAYWYNQHQDYGGTGVGNPPVAFDNISISRCLCSPVSLSVVETTDTSVTVAAANGNTGAPLRWTLSNLDSSLNPLMCDTVNGDTIRIDGLSPSTTYYLYVQALCGEDTLSRLTRLALHTGCGTVSMLPYCEGFESFDAVSHRDLLPSICWSALNVDADDNGHSAYPYYGFTDHANYVHTGSRGLMLYCSTIEPLTVVLPDFGDISDLVLAFWYRADSKNPSAKLRVGYVTRPSDHTSFVQLAEIGGGTAFSRYSQSFLDAPAGARIAFRYTPGSYSGMYGTLDDIRISRLIHAPAVSDTLCHGVPYVGNGFNIPYTNLHDGLDTLTRVSLSPTDNGNDSLHTTYLYVIPPIRTDFYDTVCSAHPYVRGEWNIPNPTSGSYVHSYTSVSGCDSIVTLYLHTLPASQSILDTICHGGSYLFHGRTLTAAGMYVDSAPNRLGCMMIDTLYLNVVTDSIFSTASVCSSDLPYVFHGRNLTASGIYDETITGPHGCPLVNRLDLYVVPTDTFYAKTICHGNTYLFVDTVVSTPGTYTRHIIDPMRCDMTHHLTLTVDPIITADVYDNACEGYPYYGNGISGVTITADTVIDVTTRNASLCDSLTHVHLSYVPTTYGEEFATISKGESYTWHNNTYTTAGDYTDVVTAASGCDSVVTLHLSVIDGVDDVSDIRVQIVPNPTAVGAGAMLYFDADVVRVEVLDNVGKIVFRSGDEVSSPYALPGLPAVGVYFVRITVSDGTQVVQKLIVE